MLEGRSGGNNVMCVPRGSSIDWARGLLASTIERFRCVVGFELVLVVTRRNIRVRLGRAGGASRRSCIAVHAEGRNGVQKGIVGKGRQTERVGESTLVALSERSVQVNACSQCSIT